MSVRLSVATGSLLVATLTTAAGLNLAVLGLDRPPIDDDPTATGSPEGIVDPGLSNDVALSSSPTPEPVALTAAQVLTVAVGQPAQATVAPAGQQAASATEVPDPSATVVPDHSAAAAPQADRAPMTVASNVSSTSTPSSAPSTSPAPATTARPPASTSTSPPSTLAASGPVASTEYLTYEFEGVASIVVARHAGDRLEFWSATTEDGWAYQVEERGPRTVKVKFRPIRGGDEAEFEVKFDGDRLKVKREY